MPPKHRMGWDRRPATASALKEFKSKFEKDMGVAIKDRKSRAAVRAISTGSLDLDLALGVGGWRTGRIHEVWGPEHVGKTTLAILSCIEALKANPDQRVGWVDMENTFDETWATQLGLDLNKVLFHTPVTAEDTADAGRRMITSGMCSMVVLDSVGGMISRAELEKEADEAVMANVAKIVTRMVLAASPIGAANGTTTLVVNQVRARISSFGPDTHTAGGWALKHVTTSRVRLSAGGDSPKMIAVDGDQVPVSKQIAARVEKNKSAAAGYRAKFWLTNVPTEKHGDYYGIDTVNETLVVGKKLGVIKGAGWLTFPNGHRVQGTKAGYAYLTENPDALSEVREKVLAIGASRAEAPSEEEALEEFINSPEADIEQAEQA